MRAPTSFGTSLCAALVAFAATACMSTKTSTPASAANNAAEMQAKWMEFATPGSGHQPLQQKIGKWSAAVSITMTPGAPPMQSTGTTEMKWIMDGRYVEDTTEGEAMGQPFHGRGLVGYDNLTKKYVSTWIDNMGTGVMTGEGTYDAARKTWNYTSQSPDVMAGKYVKARAVEKIVDSDHWTMQMFQHGPDGREFMSMEIHYTRQK